MAWQLEGLIVNMAGVCIGSLSFEGLKTQYNAFFFLLLSVIWGIMCQEALAWAVDNLWGKMT